MEAKIAAENLGAVIGFAAGAAMAVKEKLDKQVCKKNSSKPWEDSKNGKHQKIR